MDESDIALLFMAGASKRGWVRASCELLVCLCLCPNLISQSCSPLRPICSVAIEILNHWRRFVSAPRYISRLRELLRHHPLNPALSMLAFWIWSFFWPWTNGLGTKKEIHWFFPPRSSAIDWKCCKSGPWVPSSCQLPPAQTRLPSATTVSLGDRRDVWPDESFRDVGIESNISTLNANKEILAIDREGTEDYG